MPSHRRITEEVAELAALYALGLMSDAERSSLDSHLAEGCTVCAAEINRCGELMAVWAQQSSVTPSASLREKLLRTVRRGPQAPSYTASPVLLGRSGLKVIRTASMPWRPGPAPGMWIKILFDDRENEESTILIRMGADSVYPSHRHKGTEEVYVLEGQLQVEGIELSVGDFCLSQPDSVHQNTYSQSGCLLMVKTSKHDEVLG